MRHRKKGKKFGRKADPRKALLRGLATNLVLYEKITTTETKAKELRPLVEKLVTKAQKKDLTARRALLSYLYTENAVKKMIDEIVPRYESRTGGYLRIIKLHERAGDGSQMCKIEFV